MGFDLTFKIPENWNVFTVDELVKSGVLEKPLDGNHGDIHPKANDYVSTGIPFIMASDLNADKVDFNSCKFITETQAKTLRKGFAKTGDVLLSHKATIGRTAIIQESKYPFFVLTPQVTYYRVKNTLKLNNVYLKSYFDSYFFQSILQQWAGAGSTRAYLGITEQLKLPIIVPDMDTQNKISKIAKDLNDKIALNTQINQTLEAMAQALFKSWFVNFDPVKVKMGARANGGDDNAVRRAAMMVISGKSVDELQQYEQKNTKAFSKLAETADLFPERMVESELGEIPEGWEVSSVGEEFNVTMGHSPKGETYNESGDGTLFFQGRAEFSWRFPSPRLYTTDPKRMAEAGDTLMSVRAPVGDVNIALDDCCVGRGLCALRHKSGCESFTYYQFLFLKRMLDSYNGEGTVFGSINQNDLKKIPIIKATNNVVSQFSNGVTDLDKEIKNRSLENQFLVQTRDTLLPKLLSGEIDLSSFSVK